MVGSGVGADVVGSGAGADVVGAGEAAVVGSGALVVAGSVAFGGSITTPGVSSSAGTPQPVHAPGILRAEYQPIALLAQWSVASRPDSVQYAACFTSDEYIWKFFAESPLWILVITSLNILPAGLA